jgi:hypothetical protein
MPFYFRRSINFGFFRINLSKSGVGTSVGSKFLRLGRGPRGSRITANLPGTGFFYRKDYSKKDSPNFSGQLKPEISNEERVENVQENHSLNPKSDQVFISFVGIIFLQTVISILVYSIMEKTDPSMDPNYIALGWFLSFFPLYYLGHITLANALKGSDLQLLRNRFYFISERIFRYLYKVCLGVFIVGIFIFISALKQSKSRRRK